MNSKRQAVFLHTGYRTAGTWLWSCFRKLDDATAYYEPLHEMLASIDALKLASSTADSWRSGHPALEAPYFAEFAHLLEPGAGGIAGYEAEFSIDRFDGQAPPGAERLERYLRGLLDAAHQQGRVPVLKFCRSLGRLAWFRATFPDAVHIVVEKNPISQWQSCWQLFAAHRNAHFVAVPFVVLALNRHVPLVQRTIAALQVELPVPPAGTEAQIVESYLSFYKEHVATIAPLQAYRAFLAHWILTLRDAATHADALFDCDLAGHSPAYIEGAERWIRELTGLRPSFRSARGEAGAERQHGFEPLEGLQVHLDALSFARTLAASGSVEPDALVLWTSKLAQATQVMAFGAAANWPQPQVPAGRASRMVDVALIDGEGIDAILHAELAATRAALAEVKSELAQVHSSPLWRLMKKIRKLRAPKLFHRARRGVRPSSAGKAQNLRPMAEPRR
ncbi:hypothetical protein [Paraburkholderia phenazinium]|uniref:Sulfotransferase family protein n=1 Tax=Paraburkholderia phenazinium TaxID=60549 RepID=A0A1G8HRE3_9BURK|nr:hypothetical protein [Paraburkholderia phenazinium]SDI09243.1 hypothetical protein SAMN05216466_11743 [Paraburkholderia phenazinium]